MSKILKNNDQNNDYLLNDIGINILKNSEYTIDPSHYAKFSASSNLITAIGDGSLVYNDGTNDLGINDAINHLKGFQKDKISTNGLAEPDGHRARVKGMFKQIITAGATGVNCDYKMEQLQYQGVNKSTVFDGVEYYAANADNFDEITFQIVDKDNILGYGAGFVVEEFGDAAFVMPNSHVLLRFYRSQIVPNLYIRAKYTSTGNTDVKFSMNLMRHLKE